jgi:hypothetical protein
MLFELYVYTVEMDRAEGGSVQVNAFEGAEPRLESLNSVAES